MRVRRRAGTVPLSIAAVLVLCAAVGIALFHLVSTRSTTARSPSAGNAAMPNKSGRAGVQAPPFRVRRNEHRPAKYLVLIVLDGARPDYFNVPNIPHVRSLLHSGTSYTNAWAGILESETPSGHAAIGTGSNPKQDGILSFSWANSDNIPVTLFDADRVRQGLMERVMSRAGATSIARLVHGADRAAKVVALSGHKYYAADGIGGPDADVIMYYAATKDGKFAPTAFPGHGPPAGILTRPDLVSNSTHPPLSVEDHLAMRLAVTAFQRMRQTVTLINVPEFDYPLGHVDGGDRDPTMVRTLMRGFDSDLGRLEAAYRKAGVLDRTLFVITADHGFAPIYHQVTKQVIENAVATAGGDIIAASYHTAAYVWLKDGRVSARAAANIATLQNPRIQSVYFKESVPGGFRYVRASGSGTFRTRGVDAANQYLLRSFAGPKSPDLAVFYTEDTASLPGSEATWKGDHGGADWQSQHIPLVFAGPGVRRNAVSPQPARLIDIAPTALRLMGIKPTGMNGVILADAMRHSTRDWTAAQRAAGAELRPIIAALQRESEREVKAGR